MGYKEKHEFNSKQLCRKETSHGVKDLLALNKHMRDIVVSVNKIAIKEWKA